MQEFQSLKKLIEQKKSKEGNFTTIQDQRAKVEQERQKLLQDQREREREKHEKLVKKLKLQDEYYKTKEIEKITIKRLDQQCINLEKDKIQQDEIQMSQDLPPIEKKEVQKRLRDLGEPITYFGESDWQRYKRLMEFVQEKKENKQKELEIKILEGEDKEEIKAFLNKIKERNLDPSTALVPVFQCKGKEEIESQLWDGVSLLTRCEDVYMWCKKMLREWNIKLLDKFNTETLKRSLEGSQAFNSYKQTLDYIKPLTDQLHKAKMVQSINEEILNALYLIIRFCVYKEYVRAYDKYLELAIGNAPWPMGVTMVGIHERTGRSKISSSQIAHILNDETQRKYIQAIKRLITVSQVSYPSSDRSKMVDFRTEYTW
ncbi:unnamed protein product (macronuclear) [Paramecium tetraurelia]|uniref:Pre-mRNA-splicing factor 18 n=1 Tax=Paramecium tetraurelia TaxID=5888 RepID=A0BES1_PARTE|nr:uncharacterized protein GSPATT00028071001 [Paramecium tetraurelia]CAK57038.1 unnamed protein product [Paramecium tetraurelia]|eukprot:XP_001424436.1 hypothetical protein (macronuclear) [Paramecium tetraurelia strain d4-2]